MPIKTESLSFSAENQSLWGPGEALNIQIDTGDSLIYDPDKVSYDFDIGLLGFGAAGSIYLDFKIGLFAYAKLPSAGSWEGEYNLDVTYSLTGAVDVSASSANPFIEFDIVNYRNVSASIESEGFSLGAEAGLDLILGLSAGIENFSYYTWFNEDEIGDISLIDADIEVPLLNISTATPEFEAELTTGITLTGRLPSGADTENTTVNQATVTAEGASDTRFIELSADLDELLVTYASKIPGVGAVVKVLGETVFAEYEFDLNDYVSFIPAGKLKLEATVLDIGAGVGAVITEDTGLDFAGADDIPDVTVTVATDNGTASTADDDVESKTLAELMAGATPGENIIQLNAPSTGTGTANIDVNYKLNSTTFSHGVGIGLNASVTIEALSAALGGSWVPSALAFSFGPVLEAEFPDGGFNFDLFNFYEDSFDVSDAFSEENKTYQVFYTDSLPPGVEIDAPGVEQAVYRYRDALEENQQSSINTFGQLWNNDPSQTIQTILAGQNNPGTPTTNVTRIWQGDVDAIQSYSNNAPINYYIIDPLGPTDSNGNPTGVPLSNLRANLNTVFTGSPDPANNVVSGDGLEYIDGQVAKTNFVNALGVDGLTLIYTYGDGGAKRELISTNPVEIQGQEQGDVLAYYHQPSSSARASLFDGGGEAQQWDVFVANFAASEPNETIIWDLADAVATGEFVQVFSGLTVGNVESLVLKTGDGDDNITTYKFDDVLYLGGGKDIVTNYADEHDDLIYGEDGDDVFLVSANASADFDAADFIYGGRGMDRVVFDGTDSLSGLTIRALVGNTSTVALIDATSNLDAISSLNGFYSGFFLSQTVANQLNVDSDDTSGDRIVYEHNFTNFFGNPDTLSISFDKSIEEISYIGSDTYDDAVLYNGGFSYNGGSSTGDLLIADFDVFAQRNGITSGVAAAADGSTFSFGESLLGNFNRFVVRGTQQADQITGGALEDQIDALAGDDDIFGGEDSATDILNGGGGNDTFSWSNDGADKIFGSEGRDRVIITSDGSETAGIRYSFMVRTFDDSDTTTGLTVEEVSSASASLSTTGYLADLAIATLYTSDNDGLPIGQAAVTAIDANNAGNFVDTTLFYEARMAFEDIEAVNVIGSDAFDDMLIYQNGATYIGGERANDVDTFLADFSQQLVGIEFTIEDDSAVETVLANGVRVGGIDRAVILGTQGADVLGGGKFDDYFDGGAGDDRLMGGGGEDELIGGAGRDIFYWSQADVDGSDTYDGGADEDSLFIGGINNSIRAGISKVGDFSFTANADPHFYGVNVDILNNVLQADTIRVQAGFTSLNYVNIENVSIAGSDDFDDIILFQDGLAYSGGEGAGDNDIFIANISNTSEAITLDLSFGGNSNAEGNFDFQGAKVTGFEDYYLAFGSGDDRIIGGTGKELLDGGDGDDYLENGGYIDSVGGSYGSFGDVLLGGAGDDTLVATQIAGAEFNGGTFDGGADYDTFALDLTSSSEAVKYTLRDSADQDITGGFIFSSTYSTHSEFNSFFNTELPQVVEQEINGDSRYSVTAVEEITLGGTTKNDFLLAMVNDSSLVGLAGTDTLVARGGNDVLVGGAGFDTYAFDTGTGNDIIAGETVNGGRLVFANHAAANLSYSNDSNDLIITAIGGSVRVVDYFAAGGNGLDLTFVTSDFDGQLDLSGLGAPGGGPVAGTTFTGTPELDNLGPGTANSDILRGLGDSDYLLASAGSDILDGGEGEDWVSYSEETVGAGVDLSASRGTTGSAQGDVYISIEGVVGSETQANFIIGDRGANTLIGGLASDVLEGREGDDFIIGFDGVDFIYGEQGDDLLFGDDGADSLFGGTGDDVLVGGEGGDALEGGAGDDLIHGRQGDDTATGGDDDDTYFHGGDDDSTTASIDENGMDVFDGNGGLDTVDLSKFEYAVGFTTAALDQVFTQGTEQYQEGAAGNRTALFALNVERFIGTDFDDLVQDDFGRAFETGFGNDRFELLGNSGPGTYAGGGDFDEIIDLKLGSFGIEVDFSGLVNTFKDSTGSIHTVSDIEHVIATARNDSFIGDAGLNVFTDGDGVDTFEGRKGDDVVRAGVNATMAYNDIYNGGDGFDTVDYSNATTGITSDLFGVAFARDVAGSVAIGDDSLIDIEHVISGSGNDDLAGNSARNLFEAGAGNDLVRADAGDDIIIGGAGIDTIDGQGFGGEGFDVVDYSKVTQSITVNLNLTTGQVTGAGVDTDTLLNIDAIAGSQADDTFIGSGNDDHFMYSNRRGEGGFDSFNGGAGTDIADFSGFGAGIGIDLLSSFQITTRDGDTMQASEGPKRAIAELTDIETIVVTNYGDEYRGTNGDDELFTYDGDDILAGRDGADTLNGGNGFDWVDYSLETGGSSVFVDFTGIFNSVGSSSAFDTFGNIDALISIEGAIGTTLNDFFAGDDRDNHFLGGRGDDQLFGLAGENILEGQKGDDFLLSGSGADAMDGGTGVDTVVYSLADAAVTVNLDDVSLNEGFAAGDTYEKIEKYLGSNFDDKFTGGSANDVIDGNDGADQIFGVDGDDILDGGLGRDYIAGGKGRDTISGGDKGDFLFGNRGIDFIDPGAGADQIDGGGDFDRVWYGDSAGGVTVDLLNGTGARNNAANDTYTGIERVTGSAFSDSVVGNDVSNSIKTGAGDDIVFGRGGRDVIEGQSGKDELYGGASNDNLLGGADNDKLFGNSGLDKLFGGLGNDQLTGGSDTDFFVFETEGMNGFGGDVVLDFQNGTDRLDVRGVYSITDPSNVADSFSDFTVTSWTSGVKVTFESGQIIYLDDSATGVTVGDIDASDFVFA